MTRSAALRVTDIHAPQTERPVSVAHHAAEALKLASSIVEAAAVLEDQAGRNPSLKSALLEPYFSQACYNAVREQCRRERRNIWTAPNYDAGGNGARVVSHAKSLLDFPLPGGLRLRDATHKEVTAAADFYKTQATDMQRKAAWLNAIADRLTGRKKVATVFSDDSLAVLMEQVK